MPDIAVIDYGMGNLRSVAKALEHVAGADRVIVSHDAHVILAAERVVFPGQGAARDCMHEIRRLGLEEVVRTAVRDKPFLGICMGLQVLMDYSAENNGTDCLGVIPGQVQHFTHTDEAALKVPHMGWNHVHQCKHHPLWNGIDADARFYFVHSYYVQPRDSACIAATTGYGENFVSALAQDQLFAVQFHPEKSQHAGLTLLKNFVDWQPS